MPSNSWFRSTWDVLAINRENFGASAAANVREHAYCAACISPSGCPALGLLPVA